MELIILRVDDIDDGELYAVMAVSPLAIGGKIILLAKDICILIGNLHDYIHVVKKHGLTIETAELLVRLYLTNGETEEGHIISVSENRIYLNGDILRYVLTSDRY